MSETLSGEPVFGTETNVIESPLSLNDADRQAAVLVADVSGKARLHEKLSSGEAARAVDRCLKRMERAVEVFGGSLVKVGGDELMAVFATSDEAFQAAVEMQARVADLPPVSGVKLAIRVGFSYGLISENEGKLLGESVSVAAHLAALAGPSQVLASLAARNTLSAAWQQAMRELGVTAANGRFPALRTFEPILAEPDDSASKAAEAGADAAGCFSLCYAGQTILLDDSRQTIHMGRSAECEVPVRDRRASRNHARIERRGERVVLIDTSTNGSFVTFDGKPEFFVRREECILQGRGVICFAASASSADADCAQFSCP